MRISIAVRESNQIGFDGQIFSITSVLPSVILIYNLRKELRSRKNLLRQNCAAPHGELIFDGFWWDFGKQGINLASKSTPKDAKINHSEAIGFDSRTAKDTIKFAESILPALCDKTNLLVCLAIISMSDISFGEMQEKLGFDEKTLRTSLDVLIASKIVIEKQSKHQSLGLTYDINDMYHTCLCILIATIEMQRYSLKGISCCMAFGDYPVKL